MNQIISPTKQIASLFAALLAVGLFYSSVPAQTTFDFETDDQLEGVAEVSGDLQFWAESTDQSLTGSRSLKFDNATSESFLSFTYDLPIAIEEGTISVWFYDTVGQGPASFTWGGSVLLEDANDPSDFVAVEINDLPYAGAPGSLPYHASEGSLDRAATADSYDSGSLAPRTIGWHEIVFDIGTTQTLVYVDGVGPAAEVAGPGGSVADLRLRFLADSAKAGGFGNWTTDEVGYPSPPKLVYFDDITFTATAPAAATDVLDFEDLDVTGLGSGSGDPEYDVLAKFMVSAAYNEPNLRGAINVGEISTDQAHSGTNAICFNPGEAYFKSIVIDLSSANPGTVTIPFYDTLGQNVDFDKVGGAFVIEDGSDPSKFIAAEIWNAPYPSAASDKTYYFTARPLPAATSGFFSGYFPPRAVGWQALEIELTNSYSRMTINGVGQDSSNGNAVYDGPGLDSNPKLRIMADSPTLGGFNNWQDNSGWTDSETPELDALDLVRGETYLYLDDIQVPLSTRSSVEEWSLFE